MDAGCCRARAQRPGPLQGSRTRNPTPGRRRRSCNAACDPEWWLAASSVGREFRGLARSARQAAPNTRTPGATPPRERGFVLLPHGRGFVRIERGRGWGRGERGRDLARGRAGAVFVGSADSPWAAHPLHSTRVPGNPRPAVEARRSEPRCIAHRASRAKGRRPARRPPWRTLPAQPRMRPTAVLSAANSGTLSCSGRRPPSNASEAHSS